MKSRHKLGFFHHFQTDPYNQTSIYGLDGPEFEDLPAPQAMARQLSLGPARQGGSGRLKRSRAEHQNGSKMIQQISST